MKVWIIFDDHENPMGCSCCRYTGPEYVYDLFDSLAKAKKTLCDLQEEYDDCDAEYDDANEELTLSDPDGHVQHRFFIVEKTVN